MKQFSTDEWDDFYLEEKDGKLFTVQEQRCETPGGKPVIVRLWVGMGEK